VHRAHLAVAEQAARELKLDEIRFVPARLQPLKAEGPQAAADHRAAMLQAAIAGKPGWIVDLREINRPGPSYTIDTLRELNVERPRDRLFLMIGADSARDLPRWRESDAVQRLATVVVIPRPGVQVPRLPAPATTLRIDPMDVSATAVRSAVAKGQTIDHLVPVVVAEYITAHRLYRPGVEC